MLDKQIHAINERIRVALKFGKPPGTLEYTGPLRNFAPRLQLTNYGKTSVATLTDPEESEWRRSSRTRVRWLHFHGIHESSRLLEVVSHFELPPLPVEDILSPHQLPRLEEQRDYLLVFLPIFYPDPEGRTVIGEQVTLVLIGGKHRAVLSVQETEHPLLVSVAERINENRGRIRRQGPDYLFYALFDAIMDQLLVTLEHLDVQANDYEQAVLSGARVSLDNLYMLRKNITRLRRIAGPLEKACRELSRSSNRLLTGAVRIYLRDLADHASRLSSGANHLAEISRGIIEIHLSRVTLNLNETMKVLTLVGTLFIPLTFLSGVYGMNFEFMPELRWKWGYLFFWGLSAFIAGGMFVWFRSRRWLR